MKKIIATIIILCCMLLPCTALAASLEKINTVIGQMPSEEWPPPPDITSEAAILMDVDSGTILYAKNATQKMYPASTTKLMTALLTVENSEPEDIITFSSNAIQSLKPGDSHIGMRRNEKMTAKDCLYGLLLPSANEVANALAEHIGGSIEEFVSLMNERAEQLGTVNTNFSNPNGLQDENHYSCAYDLALIIQECIKNSTYLEVASTPTYVRESDELLNKEIPMATTNDMLRRNRQYYNPDVICGKTGWTEGAGRCLVTYASRDGMRLICVTIKTETPNQYLDTTALLNYGFEQFTSSSVSEADTAYNSKHLAAESPLHFPQDTIELYAPDSASHIIIPNTITAGQLERSVSENGNSSEQMVTYHYKGYALGSAPIVYVDPSSSNSMFIDNTRISEKLSTIPAKNIIVINIWLVLAGIIIVLLLVLNTIAIKQRWKYAVTFTGIKSFFQKYKK